MCAQRRMAECQNMSTTNAKVTDVSPLEQRFVKSEKKILQQKCWQMK